jgi:ABC-type taurine transport system ATPase subunit
MGRGKPQAGDERVIEYSHRTNVFQLLSWIDVATNINAPEKAVAIPLAAKAASAPKKWRASGLFGLGKKSVWATSG